MAVICGRGEWRRIPSRRVHLRTGIEQDDPDALSRRYEYYDPIYLLPESGQAWWRTYERELAEAKA